MMLKTFLASSLKTTSASLLKPHNLKSLNCRLLSSELSSALRPFYFVVHPDLFGQHPKERAVNEESLKQLSSHMQLLYERKYYALRDSKLLEFYIRDDNAEDRNTFRQIKIKLDTNSRDPKIIIQKLLELCNLSTDYIRNVKSTYIPNATSTQGGFAAPEAGGFRQSQDYNYGKEFNNFENQFYQSKQEAKLTLDSWLTDNSILARVRNKELRPLKDEVSKLQQSVIERFGLQDARYDCGWNFEHFRGCLKTLERLGTLHKDHMKNLHNRVVVFAPFTGISLEGHVMLFTGDVLNNWIDFIKKIPQHDLFLQKIPLYENALSQVLRRIRIGKRKFMPKQQAVDYAGHLSKITTTIGDYLTVNKFPKSWPETLSAYEIVIESEAGPLMISPTGQFIAPATCPGFMLIDFISTNLLIAKERMEIYSKQKYIEQELVERCLGELKLKSLTKDDSVTPDKMIESLKDLLSVYAGNEKFDSLDLHITNYYSVLTDGIVCVPWDFNKR